MFGSHSQDDPAFLFQVFPPKEDFVGFQYLPPPSPPPKKLPPGATLLDEILTASSAHLKAPKSFSKSSHHERKEMDITDHDTDTHLFSILCSSARSFLDLMPFTSWQRPPPLVNSPPRGPLASKVALGRATTVTHLETPVPLHCCPAPPSPTSVNLRCGWSHYSAGREGSERIRRCGGGTCVRE